MPVHIRAVRPEDYDPVTAVWRRCAGVVLSSADTPESFARYLERNPGLSVLAEASGTVVAALLCGHDGRRGYLHHLGVEPAHRGRGIGRRLVAEAVEGLRREGILKAHLFVLHDHPGSIAFWTHLGWHPRGDVGVVSIALV